MTRVLVNSNGKAFTTSNNRVLSSSGITPSGSISITENDTYDVTNYASAVVNVSGGGESVIETPYEITNGVISIADGADGFSFILPREVTRIAPNTFANAFEGWQNLKNADLSSLEEVYESGLAVAFSGNQISSVLLPNLITVGAYGLSGTFSGNKITSVSLPNLMTVDEYGLAQAFADNFDQDTDLETIQSIDLPFLEEVGNYGLYQTFTRTQLTSVLLPSLRILGDFGLAWAFANSYQITSASFPSLRVVGANGLDMTFAYNDTLQTVSFGALTSNSFESGDESAFNSMLYNDEDVTVHFPSNLQAVIGNWQSVSDGFGGTNTTILFDLPATE